MTVLEVIKRSSEFLAKKGVDSPRLQVELMLAHVLRIKRMGLYLNFERTLSDPELESLRDMVKRRSLREPLQHILGTACFCGIDVAVSPHVLIPRPETEMLAELGWQFLNGLPDASKPLALDFGTGSGCIAIALAINSSRAKVLALDTSADALALAKSNATQAKAGVEFFHGDGFNALPERMQFDLIISNPPYIPAADIAGLQPEVRDFDPRLALDGGADGLDFYRMFAAQAAQFLQPTGRIMLEFGDEQANSIRDLFEKQNWVVEAVKSDYNSRPRILIAQRNS